MKKLLLLSFAIGLFSFTKTIGQCNASFNFTTNGNIISFTNTSTSTPGDSIIGYFWLFGDGSSDTIANSSHTYQGCGNYIVVLNILTNNGCNTSYTDTVSLTTTANIQVSAIVDTTNGNVTINANPSLPNYIFNWSFSDGGTANGSSVIHNFLPGQHSACAVFSDSSGACPTDTFCTNFNVNYTLAPCNASFTYSANGTSISFINTSTAPGDSISAYQWSFGNFQSSIATNPTQNYASCGDYIVQLSINTSSGCSNTVVDTIQVPGQVNGNFTFNIDTLSGTVQFFATPNNSNYSFNWDFGDSTFAGGANPSHPYDEGTYTACVIISNISAACLPDTVCNTFIVDIDTIPVSCSATWTNISNGTNQTFIADSLNFNDTYNWDFGDGNTATGPIANYTYATPGTYTVCLDYTSSTTGCNAQFCDTVDIPACAMQISYTGTDGNITFNAIVSGGGFFPVVVWSFGDGGTGTGLNPTHQYTTNGFKIVCAVLNPSPLPGCKDTVCTFVNITGVGIDEFSFENSINISPNPFSDNIVLEFDLNKPIDYYTSLTDLNGREVVKSEIKKNAIGHQTNSINTYDIESGIYFICIHAEGKIIRRRIIKQ